METAEKKIKIYILGSVRKATMEDYTEELESQGFSVHLPHRDTKQDAHEIDICIQNVQAIRDADEVHVFYSLESTWSHFDLGAAFALQKPIRVVTNIPHTEGKSFANMIDQWQYISKRVVKEISRVYVAGPYSAGNVIDVLDNMRRGMRKAVQVLLAGYSPFCPWLDYHFQLMLREGENLGVPNYYDYSMRWLEASDAVLVLPNSAHSKGTQKELERARELGIPIFESISDLDIYAKGRKR